MKKSFLERSTFVHLLLLHPCSLYWYGYCGNNPINSTDPTGLWVDYGNGGRKEVDDKTGDVLCDISSDGTDNLAGEPQQGPTEPVIPEVDTASVIKSLLLGVRDGFTAPFTSEYWQNVGNFLQHPIKTSVAGFNATLFVLTQGSLEDQARMFGSMIPGIAFGQNLAIAGTFTKAANAGGIIPDREIANFIGKPKNILLNEGEVLYGIRDAGSRNVWWTRVRPQGELQWRIDQAVLPKWNAGTHIDTLVVPKGYSLQGFEGAARSQGSYFMGGGNQIYIPDVPSGWSIRTTWP